MIGSFGKAKAKGGGAAAKPLKSLTYKQLEKRQDALAALHTAGTATAKQEKRLTAATTILAQRDARHAARHPEPPPPPPPATWELAKFPTALPPDGHRWVYDSGTNSYVPEPIPLSTTPTGTTGSYYSGGGGGGGAPDFSPYAYDPSTGGGPGLGPGPATSATPSKSALEEAMSAPVQTAGLSGKVGLVVAAVGLGAWFLLRKKGRPVNARSLVAR